MQPVVLVSASLARKQLLEQMGLTLCVQPQNIEETLYICKSPKKTVLNCAMAKVRSYLSQNSNSESEWVIGADTVIWMQGKIYGKPDCESQARDFLTRLSGKCHHVWTGTVLAVPGKEKLYHFACKSLVYFRTLSPKDIDWYISTGEWRNAAGAYKLQGAGEVLVRKIKHSISNIIGLPIFPLYAILQKEQYF